MCQEDDVDIRSPLFALLDLVSWTLNRFPLFKSLCIKSLASKSCRALKRFRTFHSKLSLRGARKHEAFVHQKWCQSIWPRLFTTRAHNLKRLLTSKTVRPAVRNLELSRHFTTDLGRFSLYATWFDSCLCETKWILHPQASKSHLHLEHTYHDLPCTLYI